MSLDDLTAAFSLEGISGGNAVFNTEKLDWMNGQYIAKLPVDRLAAAVVPLMTDAGVPVPAASEWVHSLLELLRPRARRLVDFVELARPYLVDTVDYQPEAVEKHLGIPNLGDHLAALAMALRTTDPFDEPHVEAAVRGTAADRAIKAGVLIHAVRVAATGRTTSPGLFEVLALLGRDRTVQRIEELVNFLATRTAQSFS